MVLLDVHEDECGNHIFGRNLSSKVLRMRYYWPTAQQDVIDFVKKCDACQRHAHISYTNHQSIFMLLSLHGHS